MLYKYTPTCKTHGSAVTCAHLQHWNRLPANIRQSIKTWSTHSAKLTQNETRLLANYLN